MVFGREPAVFFGLVAAIIQLASSVFFNLTIEQQGALNTVVVLVTGAIIAYKVSADKALALLSGVVQAVIACALAFGFFLSADIQASIMVFVGAVVGFIVRTQVVAPKSRDGSDVPEVSTV